jgi:GGDEF domain-containing protein
VLRDAGFTPGNIPPDIDRIWKALTPSITIPEQSEHYQRQVINYDEAAFLPINQRIESPRQDLLCRYYTSHALRYSLELIRESVPDTEEVFLGLILPFDTDTLTYERVKQIDDLPMLGESLVGWLAVSGSSHTLLTAAPAFEPPNQYRVFHLRAMQAGIPEERDRSTDRTLIITNWKFSSLTLHSDTVRIIRRLLAPLYADAQEIRACFAKGMRDVLDPSTDLNSVYPDYILNGLADMAVRLGKTGGKEGWHFCCILIPSDSTFPMQLRNLIVRAQSMKAPHKIGKTLVSPSDTTISISLRAYQSGQVIYRPDIYEEDLTIALRDLENPGSAIAIPVEGEHDTPSGVLYLVADFPHAFNADDQRVLRLLGRMVQEVLSVYRARWQTVEKITDVIVYPQVIDTYFASLGILSENELAQDIETLLGNIQTTIMEKKEETEESDIPRQDMSLQSALSSTDVLSLISITIDQQGLLANRYGDQFAQNLNKVIGTFLQTQLRRILTDQVMYKLYTTCSGRFYLLLDRLSLEEARKHADRIRRRLDDTYEVDVCRPITEKTVSPVPERMQLVSASVHIAVINYTYRKLEDLLRRYTPATAIGNVRALIDRDIDKALSRGRMAGGNVVISWNPDPDRQKRGFIRWSVNPSG